MDSGLNVGRYGVGARQVERKRAAMPDRAGHGQMTTHGVSQALGHRKAQPGSTDVRVFDARASIERLEHLGYLSRVDADAAVRDAHLYLTAAAVARQPGMNSDPAVRASVLQRVRDEVLETL